MNKSLQLTLLLTIFLFSELTNTQTLATDNFSLPALSGNGPYNFQRITFDTPFPVGTIPVVVVTSQNGSAEPMSLRILNIDKTGPDILSNQSKTLFLLFKIWGSNDYTNAHSV